jgi:hypothetical protein
MIVCGVNSPPWVVWRALELSTLRQTKDLSLSPVVRQIPDQLQRVLQRLSEAAGFPGKLLNGSLPVLGHIRRKHRCVKKVVLPTDWQVFR